MRRNISAILIAALVLTALFADFIAPYSFDFQNSEKILLGPSASNWFGTDNLGRDLFSRVIYGSRVSLTVALVTSLFSLLIALAIGGFAGFKGGIWDRIIMRFVDVFHGVPHLVSMLLVAFAFNSFDWQISEAIKNVFGIVLALSLVSWGGLSRLIRGQCSKIKEMQYIEAASALGVGPIRIFMNHFIPNLLGPLLVYLGYQIPSLILFESFLSFIGLGLQPPYSSWGVLANEGWRSFQTSPHLIIFPGLFLMLTMISFNQLSDSIKDSRRSSFDRQGII